MTDKNQEQNKDSGCCGTASTAKTVPNSGCCGTEKNDAAKAENKNKNGGCCN